MSMKIKFNTLTDKRDEQLPKKTGLGGKAKMTSPGPLFKPRLTIGTNQALKSALAAYSTTDAKVIRASNLDQLNKATYTINKHLQSSQNNKGIRFSVDKNSGLQMVTVRDVRSGEVKKTIPSDSVLEIAGNLRLLAGMLADKEG